MGLIKCPRCELNYMLDTDKMCSVCKREVRGESEQYEMIELCSECGENPVVPGQELCAYCLKELTQREADTQNEETVVADASNIGDIDSVSTMDEIELDLGDDMDDEAFADEDDDFFADDDDEDGEDDEDQEDL
ncbi:MAG: hypothetical protein ACI4O8_11935 [Aristaeellaceae bacterium]|nr:hypothetical protein [Eubacteriales bacterium]